MPAYCLDVHATWRCRHEGACCRAGWSIPIEGRAFETVRQHVSGQQSAARYFVTGTPMPEGAAAILATAPGGACVFYDGRLCEIQHDLGPSAMPVACQQFPRIALRDHRGTFVTLSHFCPTAARLLLEASGNLDIVATPVSLVASSDTLEGLDAIDELPPLLRPGLLTDLDAYAEWEALCLRVLASSSHSAEQALDRIEAATRRITEWRPDGGLLSDAVRDAFATNADPAVPAIWSAADDRERFELARAAVPKGLRAPRVPEELEGQWTAASEWWTEFERAARRFVAAHLFGTWVAYQGSSLLTIVRVLKIGLSVLRVEAARRSAGTTREAPEKRFIEAVRAADLLLVHLADTPALVRAIETHENIRFRTIPSLRHHRHTLG